jgi:hypothetical protein
MLASLMALTMLPGGLLKAQAAGSKTTLDISKGSIVFGDGTVSGYGSNGNHITTPNSNGYIITQTKSGTVGYYIEVDGGNQNITLENVHIYKPRDDENYTCSGLYIENGKTNLTVSGDNSLTGANLCAGIGESPGASLVIDGGETDSLTATGENQPGICNISGDVTINGGKITAVGGDFSAGVGGYYGGNGGNVTINGGTVTAIGGGNQGLSNCGSSAGIGGGGHVYNYYGGNGGNVTITGGTVTAIGSGASAGIGGGGGSYNALGGAGSVTITGGSVKATIQNTPVNAGGASLYRTTISVPLGTDVSGLSLQQGGSGYAYGYTGMQTDGISYGKLYLWLPANAENKETTASVVTDSNNIYSGYHHTVDNSNNSVLKMDQSLAITSVLSSYTYNPTSPLFTPMVTGGAADIADTITYSGTNSITGAVITGGSTQPANIGNYTVTAAKVENAAYYSGSASQDFCIGPEDFSDNTRITLDSIPNQLYDAEKAATPTVKIDDGKTRIDSSYYSVSYLNNTGVAFFGDENPPTAKIVGKGNYTGTAYAYFTIESAPTISALGNLDDWATHVKLTVAATAGSSGKGLRYTKRYHGLPYGWELSLYSHGKWVVHIHGDK